MKNLFLILLTLFTGAMFSQAPALMTYQMVVRDNAGTVVSSANVGLRLGILQGSASGAEVFAETHLALTNTNGLLSVLIGNGTNVSGSIAAINWAEGPFFLRAQADPTGGSNYSIENISQLVSVPYALHSSEAENAQNSGNGYSHVSATGDTLYFQNGSFVIIPGISLANGGQVTGCTNNTACNYNAAATQDDGSCYYAGSACNDNNAATFNDVYNAFCVCEGSIGGSGNGSVLLPGNVTCENEYISVTGCEGQTSINYDGRVYNLVEIGSQCWFAENLATDQYRNGDAIPTGLTDEQWENTQNTQQGAYAIYNNDANNDLIYGKLYNFYAVSDPRGLCPVGWHVPTDCDWMYLEGSLGMSVSEQESIGGRGTDEGGQMKNTGTIEAGTGLWSSPNEGATNSSGFSGLPGGYRLYVGDYANVGDFGYWWSSTQYDSYLAWDRTLSYYYADVGRGTNSTRYGFSVRCLRD